MTNTLPDFSDYQSRGRIALVEEESDWDLRIGDSLLDVHNFIANRIFYGRKISSEVEFAARVHSIRFSEFHADLLWEVLPGAIVVDVGCGQIPYLPKILSRPIGRYYGLDLSAESLDLVDRWWGKNDRLCLVQHGVYNLPFEDSFADVVISSEVIEHIDRPHEHLSEIARICKPGGVVSLSTPCPSMYWYPHRIMNLITLRGSIREQFRKWSHELHPHRDWRKALAWHPALPPKVLRGWIKRAGLLPIRHETRLWYYGTPWRPSWRLFEHLEKSGLSRAGSLYRKYLRGLDRILQAGIPILKWAGIRQFVLSRKGNGLSEDVGKPA